MVSVVPQAQIDRVDIRGDRQFVHRAFEREQTERRARRPHVSGRVDVELGQFVAQVDIRRVVEHSRPVDDILLVVLELRGRGHRVVLDRHQLAAGIGAERHGIYRLRPVDVAEHLLTRQLDAHRAFERQ